MLLVSITSDHTLKSRMMGNYHVRFGSGGAESDLSANHNKLRSGERWNFERAKKSLRESKRYDGELRSVYGKLLAEVYYRLDRAMLAFYKRVKAGERTGFPRFKPRHQFFTLCYPAMYMDTIEGNTIILPTGGKGRNKHLPNIVAHLTEQPPDHFHEVAVSRNARGNYYCSFVFDDAEQV
jgi:hypothetical protein